MRFWRQVNEHRELLILCVGLFILVWVAWLYFQTIAAYDAGDGLKFNRVLAWRVATVFAISAVFFSALFNHPVSKRYLSQNLREVCAKSIDYIWYPLGIATAVLALQSSQIASANAEKHYRDLIARDLVAKANLNWNDVVEACSSLSGKKLEFNLAVEVAVDGAEEQTAGGRFDLLCAGVLVQRAEIGRLMAEYHQKFPSQVQPEAFQKASRESAIAAGCQYFFGIETALPDLIGFQKPSVQLSKSARSAPNPNDNENLLRAANSLANYCGDYLEGQIYANQIDTYNKHISDNFLGLSRPWFWVSLLAILAGLKVSKTTTELCLMMEKRRQNRIVEK